MTFDGLPLVVGWELTLACNLRCRHCGSSAGPARVRELTLEESLSICDQLPELLVQEVDFTGGEPLLNPFWPQIARRLTAGGIRVKVITNGVALSDARVAALRDAGISGLGFSLDGLEATHDAIRGLPGLYRRVLDAIDRARDGGFTVTVITTVNAHNLDELPALLVLLREHGVSRWQLQPLFPLGRGRDAEDMQMTGAQYLALRKPVQAWAYREEALGIYVTPADSLGYFSEAEAPGGVTWHGCPAGRISCGITSDGKVKGCLSLPDHLIEGDLREKDLWSIWFAPGAFAYTRDFKPESLGANCRGCELGEMCRGGCSAMSFGSTGVFHNDPYCFHSLARRNPAAFRDAWVPCGVTAGV